MSTTIQVQEKTLRFLKGEKKRLKAGTYDEVIRRLVERGRPAARSLFGVDKGRVKAFSEKEHLDFHEHL